MPVTSEAEPQESATPCGQALKERRSRLWKWNLARLICRSFGAWSILVCPLGFRFASPQAEILLTLRVAIPSGRDPPYLRAIRACSLSGTVPYLELCWACPSPCWACPLAGTGAC